MSVNLSVCLYVMFVCMCVYVEDIRYYYICTMDEENKSTSQLMALDGFFVQ